ncbi:MAG: Methylsterol monooxygenase 1 [Sclerophora amabilis]|nr:MAG: Methylsterol monooxygenase 1 [Sclerophora amabilis]
MNGSLPGVLLLLVIGISHVSKWLVQQVTKRVQSIGTQQKSPYPSTKPTKRDIDDRNLMIHIPLLVDFAVEFPLIVAFHPMTQILGSSSDVPFPRGPELLTQMAVFFVVEWASRPWVDRMLSDVVLTSNKGGPGTNAPQDSALMLSSAFISPRLTLMIGITLVDALSLLVTFTGRLHLITVVLWASLRRI